MLHKLRQGAVLKQHGRHLRNIVEHNFDAAPITTTPLLPAASPPPPAPSPMGASVGLPRLQEEEDELASEPSLTSRVISASPPLPIAAAAALPAAPEEDVFSAPIGSAAANSASFRFIYLRGEGANMELCWARLRDRAAASAASSSSGQSLVPLGSFPVSWIGGVCAGSDSPTFTFGRVHHSSSSSAAASASTTPVDTSLCLSVLLSSGDSLDLEASSRAECAEWMRAFAFLHRYALSEEHKAAAQTTTIHTQATAVSESFAESAVATQQQPMLQPLRLHVPEEEEGEREEDGDVFLSSFDDGTVAAAASASAASSLDGLLLSLPPAPGLEPCMSAAVGFWPSASASSASARSFGGIGGRTSAAFSFATGASSSSSSHHHHHHRRSATTTHLPDAATLAAVSAVVPAAPAPSPSSSAFGATKSDAPSSSVFSFVLPAAESLGGRTCTSANMSSMARLGMQKQQQSAAASSARRSAAARRAAGISGSVDLTACSSLAAEPFVAVDAALVTGSHAVQQGPSLFATSAAAAVFPTAAASASVVAPFSDAEMAQWSAAILEQMGGEGWPSSSSSSSSSSGEELLDADMRLISSLVNPATLSAPLALAGHCCGGVDGSSFVDHAHRQACVTIVQRLTRVERLLALYQRDEARLSASLAAKLQAKREEARAIEAKNEQMRVLLEQAEALNAEWSRRIDSNSSNRADSNSDSTNHGEGHRVGFSAPAITITPPLPVRMPLSSSSSNDAHPQRFSTSAQPMRPPHPPRPQSSQSLYRESLPPPPRLPEPSFALKTSVESANSRNNNNQQQLHLVTLPPVFTHDGEQDRGSDGSDGSSGNSADTVSSSGASHGFPSSAHYSASLSSAFSSGSRAGSSFQGFSTSALGNGSGSGSSSLAHSSSDASSVSSDGSQRSGNGWSSSSAVRRLDGSSCAGSGSAHHQLPHPPQPAHCSSRATASTLAACLSDVLMADDECADSVSGSDFVDAAASECSFASMARSAACFGPVPSPCSSDSNSHLSSLSTSSSLSDGFSSVDSNNTNSSSGGGGSSDSHHVDTPIPVPSPVTATVPGARATLLGEPADEAIHAKLRTFLQSPDAAVAANGGDGSVHIVLPPADTMPL
jgi:hypothetical protein